MNPKPNQPNRRTFLRSLTVFFAAIPGLGFLSRRRKETTPKDFSKYAAPLVRQVYPSLRSTYRYRDGRWRQCRMKDIQKGDDFALAEADGSFVVGIEGHTVHTALGSPYQTDKGIWCIDSRDFRSLCHVYDHERGLPLVEKVVKGGKREFCLRDSLRPGDFYYDVVSVKGDFADNDSFLEIDVVLKKA